MRKQVLTLMMGALLPLSGFAQRLIGTATSNWSGTNGVYLNPANLADSRHKFSIDLFALNFGVDNNLGTINSSKVFGSVSSDDDISSLLTVKNNGKFNVLLPYAEIRGPGFSVSLGDKHGIALTTRARIINNVNNIDQNIFKTVTKSNDQTDYSTTGQQFNLTGHAWTEIGLSYGGVIYNKNEKHMIKGGLSARYLLGIGYYSVNSRNLDVSYQASTDLWTIKNSDLQFGYGGVNPTGGGDVTKNLFKGAGKGFGADLGLVYEFRPDIAKYKYDMDGKSGLTDRGSNPYMLRFSVAATDLGSIKYSNNNQTISISNTATTVLVGKDISNQVKNRDSLTAYARAHGMTVKEDSTTATKVKLPTALVASVDYHAVKGLYLNLMYIGSLASTAGVGNNYYSQITLTPRYDVRIFSAGIPITFNMQSKSIKAGLGLRLAGFVIGTDDMLGLFTNGAYGANFYMGLSVPFAKKKPRDSDGDQVSNKKDKCPGVKGVWAFMGCPDPDTDHDGIPDTADKCPTVAGSKTAMGCPDADLDSIADATDRCPTEAGTVAMQGCPDRDGDGIADIDDACPDQKGLAQFKGCPDRDGDGIADGEDACPDKPGPLANKGCPDTDNDGIPDNEDKCPLVKGTRNNQGCPEISVEVKKRLAFAATAIQFETGKAVIKKASFSLLDEIVKILNDYPDYYMTIDGHTDNVGKPAKNMVLSKDRADAVKNYMVGHGISESRLQTNGYGDTQPVESNKTAKGRAKNRRVAMDLKLQQ